MNYMFGFHPLIFKIGSEKRVLPSRVCAAPDLSDFVDEGCIGHGGFGVVHKVRHGSSEEYMAVKLTSITHLITGLRRSYISMVSMDKIGASVMANAPFLVKIFASFIASAADTEHKLGVMIMEFISGVDLLRYVEVVNKLNGDRVWHLLAQIVTAVESLHLHGLIHRDMKLGNVIIQPSGIIKIIDFDLCKVCIEHAGEMMLKSYFRRTCNEFKDREKAGTEAYIAPEIHDGKPYGRASDWWSVGVIFYKLLTGKLPFRGKDILQVIQRTTLMFQGNPTHRLQLKAEDLCLALLNKNPADRAGSRDYADILGHGYFDGVDFEKLAVMDMPLSPEELECARMDLTPLFKDDAAKSSRVRMAPPLTRVQPAIDSIDRSPLFTYVSVAMEEMIAVGPLGGGPDLTKDEQFENRACRDLTRLDSASSITVEYLTNNSQLSSKVAATIELLAHWDRCWLLPPRAPLKLKKEPCLDGSMRFVVHKIRAIAHYAGTGGRLLDGDIVLCINGIKLDDLSRHVAMKLITESREPFVVFKVITNNPFRQLEDTTFDVDQVVCIFGKKTQRFISRLTPGDIILSINGTAAGEIQDLVNLLQKRELNIEFTPCSPLRLTNID
ncbi:microtubule-associated serine/threonine-protein kinase 2-like [Tropilaelaps mercedesae]|uniref:Microtubule-associated serine/threonine-protein kinase 2-like n=1 Tax=Tropilaelaps mercedesae TaxID=418985 RepID=A0A1V9Y379_9ACAR|nr:microtubule-associated serine/threonine-protein kinase 2-like [Tropilaelaps mercedesae]